ncbi:MAG: sugar kinase [Thermoguttaceae bacterium]|nr:sugar kinase [Thermoguttaceae bacterium]MBR0192773.1 sugar kinase [Thermoguttaceae bacterium]
MADLLIVGSFAFDTINTQTARRENVLGGTGSHASYGASFYTKVFASGRVGGADWKDEDSKMLQAHNINIENLQIVPGEKTTSWEAVYEADMNNRSTLSFCPNCCVEFHPNLTEAARKCPYIFLANNSPASQMEVIESAIAPKLIVADTMDYYINGFRGELDEVLKKVDGLILNDSEAQLLAGKTDLFECADEILKMGPNFVIIKKGAHGSLFQNKDGKVCVFPAYPSRKVIEPTGAGDCFAGAFMGYLASQENCDFETIKKAMIYATVTASFTIEDFSFDALKRSTRADIDRRFEEMREMLRF